MEQNDNGIFAEDRNKVSLKERVYIYLVNWPLFLICLLICVGAGIVYTRYALPKYISTTSFLIKGAESGKPISEDLIESSMSAKKEVNLNNEMLLISAASLMERTVSSKNFNISYFKKGRILDIDIYKDAPFTLYARKITDSSYTCTFHIKKMDKEGGIFLYGPEKTSATYSFKWGIPFSINEEIFVLELKKEMASLDGEFIVRWQPVSETAAALSKELVIKAFDTKTSVIQLSLKTENLERGKDILNTLFSEFYSSDIEDRSKLSENTVRFIDDRLLLISDELKGVEGNLESYQGNNQLVDIKGQSTQSLENADNASKTIKDLSIQQGVVSIILNYFSNQANSSKLVPSSLGLNDATLALLISQYNELQLKREREAPMLAPNSTVMLDLNAQLSNLKSSILESLNNISKNLSLQENNFRQQNTQYRSFLSSVPHNERVLQEIKRKQGITEGLYLYLLQKREEAAISSTSSKVAHYIQIDKASGYGPVEPNKTNIIMYTFLLGLFLAFGIIYIRDLLDDKIKTKNEVAGKLQLPISGEISHISKKNLQPLVVMGRTLVSEEFRAIRTRLYSMMKNKSEKVILVTSSLSNEGKSFISLNLAAVCAMPGNKVALLEFDIRKPVFAEELQFGNSKGIADYLNGDACNLSQIKNSLAEIQGLDIFIAGSIPLNPADLLLSEKMDTLINELKREYDYIIIDSPPAHLISDAFVLGKYSDLVLYIIRYQFTLKNQLEFINETVRNKSLKNVMLVLNDKKNTNKYGSYGNNYYANASEKN